MTRLHKSPEVKRQLHKDWVLDKPAKKGGSIFDDFLAEESESSEEEKPPLESINVDEAKLMSSAIDNLLAKGETPLALLLTLEWPQHIVKLDAITKQMLANTLTLDTLVSSTSVSAMSSDDS